MFERDVRDGFGGLSGAAGEGEFYRGPGGHGEGFDGESYGVGYGASAVAAGGFAEVGVDLVDDLAEGAEALWAVDEDVVGLEGMAALEIDPKGGGGALGAEGGVVDFSADGHELEEVVEAGGLLVEAVGGDAAGDAGAGVGTAGGDDVDAGVETAHDGEELKAGHAGHVEVGEKDVGEGLADHAEGLEAVLCNADGEAALGEDLLEQAEHGDFIVDDQQIEFVGRGLGHDLFLQVAASGCGLCICLMHD
jgi:hypothetical protein